MVALQFFYEFLVGNIDITKKDGLYCKYNSDLFHFDSFDLVKNIFIEKFSVEQLGLRWHELTAANSSSMTRGTRQTLKGIFKIFNLKVEEHLLNK